MIKIVHKQLGT